MDPSIISQRQVAFMNNPRTVKIVEMYRQGITLEKIGKTFGFTREMARKILKRAGIDPQSGGARKRNSLTAAERERSRKARIDARYIERHGLTRDELWSYPVKIRRAYQRQESNAKSRNIEWKLKFADWIAIWKESGKLDLRGKSADSYVMSRIRNDGPYEIGNVHIQTLRENSKEVVAKWLGAPKKPCRGVFLLYPGRANPWNATHRGKSLGYFPTQESAAMAKKLAAENDRSTAVGPGLGAGKGRGWSFYGGRYIVQYRNKTIAATRTKEDAEHAYWIAHLTHQGKARMADSFASKRDSARAA